MSEQAEHNRNECAILQPDTGIPHGMQYLSSLPEHIIWGQLPSTLNQPVMNVRQHEDFIVDTVSHEGLLPDQGSDPLKYFCDRGIHEDEILQDAVAIARTVPRDPLHDGPHVVTGPIAVEGAHRGDWLAVSVRSLEKRVPYGVISTRHAKGVLAGDTPFDDNYGLLCKVEDNQGICHTNQSPEAQPRRVKFELHPFLGIMGVTPNQQSHHNSVPPLPCGGNIDLKELTSGSILFLPVQVEGAGLYIGDPHFAQGNGEVSLTALEASLRATLNVSVVPEWFRDLLNNSSDAPLAYAQGRIITTGLGSDLNTALKRCTHHAVRLISNAFAIPQRDAYLLLSATTDFNITQAVDIVTGVHALINPNMFRNCEGYATIMDVFESLGAQAHHQSCKTARHAFDTGIWRVVGSPLVNSTHSGPLDGLGIAVKDLFAVNGFAIGAGNPKFLDEATPQTAHAPAVASLLQSGAHIVGIAQTDEFAYSLSGVNIHYGATVNPAAPGHISGGSSSGPAAAVSSRQADIGLGTDTAGSIRVPAAYQGLWGIRTTTGRIARQGIHPLSHSFDTVGILAREATTLGTVARQLMPDADAVTPHGIVTDPLLDELIDEDVRKAFCGWRHAVLAHHQDAHNTKDTIAITAPMLDTWLRIFQIVRGFEAWQSHGAWIHNNWDSLDPQIATRFEHDMHITREQYQLSLEQFAAARTTIRALIGNHMLLIPTVSCVAPRIGGNKAALLAIAKARAETMRLTVIAGVGGLPAVNIPLTTKQGLACGACLIGPAQSDNSVIAAAAELADSGAQFA